MRKLLIFFILFIITSCAPAPEVGPTPDVNATVYALVDSLPVEDTPTAEIVVITATPEPTLPATEAPDPTVEAFNELPSDQDPVYEECPLEVQYFEEMMWNGEVAIQKGPKSNFSEYGGHMAWVKLPTASGGYDRKPIVLTQRCAWFVQGVLYRDNNIGFTAQLDSTGTKTVACTWWELKPNGLSTSPCYLEVKNPYQEDGLYKVYGTIAINGSFRVGVCMGADKENLVGDVACKFPGGNTSLGLLEYPYDLEVPGLSD